MVYGLLLRLGVADEKYLPCACLLSRCLPRCGGAPKARRGPRFSALFCARRARHRVGEHADHTRFVWKTSDPVKVRVFTLADPDRVVITMPEVGWRSQATDRPTGRGAVKDYRYGQFRAGDSRVIIDLNTPVTPRAPVILPPRPAWAIAWCWTFTPRHRPSLTRRRDGLPICAKAWPTLLRCARQSH